MLYLSCQMGDKRPWYGPGDGFHNPKAAMWGLDDIGSRKL